MSSGLSQIVLERDAGDSSREVTLEKGEPVVVTFFGEHAVRGIVDDVDKAKALIAIGQGAWTITAPRNWIRQREDDWVLDLG